MPFTGSHPAVVLPFLRSPLPASALVIGSMAPDLPFYLPLPQPYATHTWLAAVTTDLLLGLLAWALWHGLLAGAALATAPAALRGRLEGRVLPGLAGRLASARRAVLLVAALVLGTGTHLAWDDFTHARRWGAEHVPALAQDWGPLPGYRWLQYLSSVVGLAVLAVWFVRWWRRTPAVPVPEPAGRNGAYITGLGDAGSIRFGELPDPEPGPEQVLVRVRAVAVDRVDTYVRSGAWPTRLAFPAVVGRDLVGTVVETGQPVWTNSAGYDGRAGATADLVVVDRDRLYELPPGADPVSFVAAVHPGATAHGALLGRARLRAGETVAVVGANGAVGMCLVQVAAATGARVVAVVRREEAAARLRQLGAAEVVVAEADAAPAAAAGVAGIDVLVDGSGRVPVAAAADALAPRGRMVLVAGRGRAELDVWRFYTKELQLLGFIMSAMTREELRGAADWINRRHDEQPLTVGVGRVLGFSAAAEAHAALEAGDLPRLDDGTVGRIVLVP
jgi:NADPH:quinone reductase-like Zn-dependent oxidoreductase